MDFQHKSTAGVRQFEQTAIAKLVAEGVPQHVAHAFVHIGLPKSGRVQSVKDHVCKMRFEKFFYETKRSDFEDPFSLGTYVPFVQESNQQRFHTEFAMTDIDAARFGKQFPEFDVVIRGRSFNQHAFYANKRYAEAELLVSMVYSHAATSGLNPRSLIDLGGNQTWHAKRGRDYVHCDNPVLSARDVMRYKSREIFSGTVASEVCEEKFSDCPQKADYAISVHSTYDISPKRLAADMRKKGVSQFYGVLNYIPGIEQKREGTYESDGIVMTVCRPPRDAHFVRCSFKHDPSLVYNHRLSILRKYIYVQRRYDFHNPDGSVDSYTYRICSVRGNSIIFSISKGGSNYYVGDTIWTPPARKLYYISLQFLGVSKLEVDSELFDRLVLEACGARNFKDYDIVSLFRFAKSLRQRVSINNVVLSSGYTSTPEELVHIVIAAYGVAAAYRVESANFFKEASSQLLNLRGRGFIRNVFRLGGLAFLSVLLALPAAFAKVTGLSSLNDKITRLIASKGSITVEVDKPHSGHGIRFDKSMLRPSARLSKVHAELIAGRSAAELSHKFHGEKKIPLFANVEGSPVSIISRGLVAYDENELPRTTGQPQFYDFSHLVKSADQPLEEVRKVTYAAARDVMFGIADKDTQAIVMPNADRVYRNLRNSVDGVREQLRDDITLVDDEMTYVVFRGVGRKAVVLTKPSCYNKGRCLRFVMFYDQLTTFADYKTKLAAKGYETGTIFELQGSTPVSEDFIMDKDQWTDLSSTPTVVTFAPPGFVERQAEQGNYYMSGALPFEGVQTPPLESPDIIGGSIGDYVSRLPTVLDNSVSATSDVSSDAASQANFDSGNTVSSSDIIPGLDAIKEGVLASEEAEKVALASAKAIADLAIATARGDAPMSRFQSVSQGHPGHCLPVRVEGETWTDMITGEAVSHMAVSDGDSVYDKITKYPPDGVYITSDVMRVYTGAAIKRSIESVLDDNYVCPVVCIDGPAGSGKTYHIVQKAKPGDVVMCETGGALRETARDLMTKVEGWTGHAYTVDSFLMHVPVKTCNTLWIDEAYRLHASKIYAVMKILKPKLIFALGDEKQIPIISFIPGFDFIYHKFSFSRIDKRLDTYRMPCDVSFGLSREPYYPYHVRTHNPILRSVGPIEQFVSGMFQEKKDNVPLLVFTQTVKEELVKQGVKYVMTVGESQGHTFDDVILYRHTSLPLALFMDHEQALVAISRHRRTFRYVTADTVMRDDSFVARIINYIRDKGGEFLFASHLAPGVKGVSDASAYYARQVNARSGRNLSVTVVDYDDDSFVDLGVGGWADHMAEAEEDSSFVFSS